MQRNVVRKKNSQKGEEKLNDNQAIKTKKNKLNKMPMKNITINLPSCYDAKIQYLIENKLIASRSEAIRTALRDFLRNEYENNLDLLGYEDFVLNNNKNNKMVI